MDCVVLTLSVGCHKGLIKVPVCVQFYSPGTALGRLTEVPSGGLSPTMLGSWAPDGGEYAGALELCSWSNFFGTAEKWRQEKEVGDIGEWLE